MRMKIAGLFMVSALFALAALIYTPGLKGPFLFDDYSNVFLIQPSAMNWEELLGASLSNSSGDLKRPVSNLSFGLNYLHSGLTPAPYKLTNLVIHLLCGLVILLLSRLILRHTFPDQTRRLILVASTAICAAWLLHPLQVSTVLYVVQRMAQLSALFTLLALLLYVTGRLRLLAGQRYGFVLILTGLLVCGPLALFSKENGALIPLFILATEWILFRFQAPDTASRRWLHLLLGITCVFPLVFGVVYLGLHHESFLVGYHDRHFTLGERLLTQSRILLDYIGMILLPDLSIMSLHHDDYPVQRVIDTGTLLAIGTLLGLAILVLLLRKRAPLAAWGIAFYLVAHSMESTIFPLELMFEHRNYLALLGLLFVITQGILSLLQLQIKPSIRRILAVFPVVALVMLATLTTIRVGSWSSKDTLVRTMLVNHPESLRLQVGLAESEIRNRDFPAAYERIDYISGLQPWNPGPHFLRLLVQCLENTYAPDAFNQARDELLASSIHSKMTLATLKSLTNEYIDGKCPAIPPAALIVLIDSGLQHQTFTENKRSRQILYGLQGLIQNYHGEEDQAIIAFEKAFEAFPSEIGPLFTKAYTELRAGRIEHALTTARRIENDSTFRFRYHAVDLRELKRQINMALARSTSL